MVAGARVEVAPYKRHPGDFVLWKPSDDPQPGWDSPWGWGRPGWHLECSAMAAEHLGETIDIHGGGQDLVFPHHENEMAQSVCAHGGKPFARYWMHNGFVTVDAGENVQVAGQYHDRARAAQAAPRRGPALRAAQRALPPAAGLVAGSHHPGPAHPGPHVRGAARGHQSALGPLHASARRARPLWPRWKTT